MALVVGLTGGIGSGKSFVARLFAACGVSVIDADYIAHTLTAKDGAALNAIIACFGASYLIAPGILDRAKLRQRVFSDAGALADLEAITHPLIRDALAKQTLSVAAAPYVIHMIPLLVESGQWRKRVDRVLVVDCPPETQIVRVMRRSQLSRDDVLAIMARQVTRAARLAVADDVIDNYGELEMTVDDQVRVLHQRYLYLAGSPAVGP